MMKLALFGLLCLPAALAMATSRADLEEWEVRSDLTPPLQLEMLLRPALLCHKEPAQGTQRPVYGHLLSLWYMGGFHVQKKKAIIRLCYATEKQLQAPKAHY